MEFDRRRLLGSLAAVGIASTVGGGLQAKQAPPPMLVGLDGKPSSIAIDHFSLGVANLTEGTQRLRAETGFGSLEGSWFPGTGIANNYLPLGGDEYIEVESCVDVHAQDQISRWFGDQTADGDAFLGWCVRVSSHEEIERIAKRLGTKVEEGTLAVRPDGSKPTAIRTPDSFTAWKKGLPSFFCYPTLDEHVSRRSPTIPSRIVPNGVAWVEVGGTARVTSDWLGIDSRQLPIRFSGGELGLRAIGVRTADKLVEIRRKPIRII